MGSGTGPHIDISLSRFSVCGWCDRAWRRRTALSGDAAAKERDAADGAVRSGSRGALDRYRDPAFRPVAAAVARADGAADRCRVRTATDHAKTSDNRTAGARRRIT